MRLDKRTDSDPGSETPHALLVEIGHNPASDAVSRLRRAFEMLMEAAARFSEEDQADGIGPPEGSDQDSSTGPGGGG